MYKPAKLHHFNLVSSLFGRTFASHEKLHKLLASMPQSPKHIADAQKQRKMRTKVMQAPGIVNLQILGCGANGAPSSVYLFSDQTRYLFNCGEGTQRLAYEHKTKLSCLENIFMTRTSWERLGGLPGICLTMQDVGVPEVNLHGPPGLGELFVAMRRFVILKDMKVEAKECVPGDTFDDNVLTVHYVPIKREPSAMAENESEEEKREEAIVDDTDYYAYERKRSTEVPPRKRNHSPSGQQWTRRQEENVMAYICKLKGRFGQLNFEKCVEKGVPAGPWLGQLKNGNDITLPNGNVVKSVDVRGPDDPGPVFIFIDIPSASYFKGLAEVAERFAPYQNTATTDADQALFVLHFTSLEVMRMPEYRQFMNRFTPSTQHIALNDINSFSGCVASNRIQHHLHQLDCHIFPLLKENNNDYSSPCTALEDFDLVRSSSFSILHVRPKKGIDRTQEASIRPEEYLAELQGLPGFNEKLSELKRELALEVSQRSVTNRNEQFPRLVFLGTGSSIPNKTRNVSSILVHTNSKSCILLDCGEGTAGQLVRFFGTDRLKEIVQSIKAIYISHLHADHHLGLIGILQMRRQLLGEASEPVLLLAPEQMSYWLRLYDSRFESIRRDFQLIKNANLLENPLRDSRVQEMGITEISTCYVRHCPHSFGVALTVTDAEGKASKITYSGDTMPCKDLVDLGRNSTILIHEATMEDELIAEAKVKMHSTLSQAIEQGRKMNARYTLLTHFSQRYAKIPRIKRTELDSNLGIAFDNMEVTMDDLPLLSRFYPALKEMFISHFEEMELKAVKRSNRMQRQENIANGSSGTSSAQDVDQQTKNLQANSKRSRLASASGNNCSSKESSPKR